MIERLTDVQYFGCVACSRASEVQARMVLRVSDQILADRRQVLLHNKELLTNFIEKTYSEWFEWVRPNAGAIAFVKFRGPMSTAELGVELASEGISIKPAYCFAGDKVSEDVDYFRVGFGERRMPTALEALGRFVDRNSDGWRRRR